MGADTAAVLCLAGHGVIRMLIRNARVWPSTEDGVDVRIAAGRIVECEPGLRPAAGEDEIDAAGCALLPGLHDHHVHLRALAAAQASVQVGPEWVRSAAELSARLRAADAAAPPGAWLRCVGYHESVAGPLDRWALDRLMADRTLPGTAGAGAAGAGAAPDRRAVGGELGRAGCARARLTSATVAAGKPGWSATPTAGRPGGCGGWTTGWPTAFPLGRPTSPPASPR